MVLFILGFAIQVLARLRWVSANGFDVMGLVTEMASNMVSTPMGMNSLICSIATTAFIIFDGFQRNIKLSWLPVVVTWVIGASAGLPMFLYLQAHNEIPTG